MDLFENNPRRFCYSVVIGDHGDDVMPPLDRVGSDLGLWVGYGICEREIGNYNALR